MKSVEQEVLEGSATDLDIQAFAINALIVPWVVVYGAPAAAAFALRGRFAIAAAIACVVAAPIALAWGIKRDAKQLRRQLHSPALRN